jgi:sulfur-carrier protein adenylyltransferase/sulfurtransferase
MLGIPWVYAAILAFEGQLSVFNVPPGIGPDYRDLLPVPPLPGDIPSCAEGGVLGALPGTLGCLQATETIKYLLGHTSGLVVGRVLVMDAMQMTFRNMGLVRSTDRVVITKLMDDYQGFCAGGSGVAGPIGGASSIGTGSTTATKTSRCLPSSRRTMDEDTEVLVDNFTALSSLSNNMASTPASFHTVTPKACLEKLIQGWTPWVLDVRLPTEHDIVALPFTDRVVSYRTVRREHDVPIRGDVLVYCKAGVRGAKACRRMVEQGVAPDRLYNLEGGIMQWQADVDPSMARY